MKYARKAVTTIFITMFDIPGKGNYFPFFYNRVVLVIYQNESYVWSLYCFTFIVMLLTNMLLSEFHNFLLMSIKIYVYYNIWCGLNHKVSFYTKLLPVLSLVTTMNQKSDNTVNQKSHIESLYNSRKWKNVNTNRNWLFSWCFALQC